MVDGCVPHFELASFLKTLFLAAVFAFTLVMCAVAKCSVKSNSQVDWGWSMFQFLSTPLYVQLSVRFSVPEVKYACLCLVWVGTQMVLLVVVANAV